MKKLVCILCAFIIFIGGIPGFAASEISIASEAAVVMDAKTGQVIYSKNGRNMMYPASLTKIMTGLIATERLNLSEDTTVNYSAVNIAEPQSTNVSLTAGEVLSVNDLMHAMLLVSANDAANVLAEAAGGTQEDFALIMNDKSREIGAFDTHFENAHGLHGEGHYTTAYDIALITREALKNKKFLSVFSKSEYTMQSTNKSPAKSLTNIHSMMLEDNFYYDSSIIGGKTGFTNKAQSTMVSVAKRKGRTLICVVLYSTQKEDKYKDTRLLLNYGFSEFSKYKVAKNQFKSFNVPIKEGEDVVGSVSFSAGEDFEILLHNDINPKDVSFAFDEIECFNTSDEISARAYLLADTKDTAIPGLLGEQVLRADIKYLDGTAGKDAQYRYINTGRENKILSYIVILLAITVLIMILYLCKKAYKIKKMHKARMKRLSRKIRLNYKYN